MCLWHGGLCAVSPARGCGAGRGVGGRGLLRRLLPDTVRHRRRRKQERGTSSGWRQSPEGPCAAIHEPQGPGTLVHPRLTPGAASATTRPLCPVQCRFQAVAYLGPFMIHNTRQDRALGVRRR
jgi:hypothetical protein